MILQLISAKIDRVIDDYKIESDRYTGGFFITVMKLVEGQKYRGELNFPGEVVFERKNEPAFFEERVKYFLQSVAVEITNINQGKQKIPPDAS